MYITYIICQNITTVLRGYIKMTEHYLITRIYYIRG